MQAALARYGSEMGDFRTQRLTNGGDSGDNLTQLQFVQNRGFTSGIQTDHENTHFLVTPKALEQL